MIIQSIKEIIARFTESLAVKLLMLLTIFCGVLITTLSFYTDNFTYLFLGWNLFLAWVPLLFSLIWKHRLALSKPLAKWKQLGLFFLWLLFWPNAPYLITDLVHLNKWFNPAQWMDILLFFAAAATGLLVGMYSLHKVHQLLNRNFTNLFSWCIVLASIILSSYGIYLGRVQRWNSWDIVTRPFHLIKDAFIQLGTTEAWTIIIGFSLFLSLSYYITYQIIHNVKNKK